MLDFIRDHAGGFGAKLLLAFLIVTFAIWGIGDMVRHPASGITVATIGDKTVTLNQYQRALRRETENMEHALGDRYSPELAKSMHLSDRVLRKLIDDELIRMDAENLGLMPSDSDVVRRIRSNQAFQDNKGNFDKSIFDAMLRNSNMSEKSYVDSLRQEMASSLVIDTITAIVPVPPAAEHTLYEAQEEQRIATFYTIGAAQAGAIPQPDDKALQAYYNDHVHEFSAPEYRIVSYTSFKSEDAKAKATVSEDELKKAYQSRQDEFKRPERRTVDQLLYSREEEAKKAYDALQGGTSFEQEARTSDILNKNSISLGAVERGHIVESAEAAVFALQTGQITKPIQSPFGWHIFRVTKIDPPSVATFEEARPALEKEMKQLAQEESVSKLSNTLEDALAGGSSLQEAAKDLGLSVATVGPMDRDGNSPEGKEVKLPDFDKFLDVAFKTDEKAQSSLTPSKNGVYYIVSVDSVKPEHALSFDEVKSDVLAGWQKQQRYTRISTIAQEIAGKMEKKDGRENVIATYHLSGTTPAAFKRTAKTAGDMPLPEPLVMDIFSHRPGDATGAYPAKGSDYVIAVVKDIVPGAAPDAKNTKAMEAIHDQLSSSAQDEIFSEYMRYLAGKYRIKINESLLASLDKSNAAEQ